VLRRRRAEGPGVDAESSTFEEAPFASVSDLSTLYRTHSSMHSNVASSISLPKLKRHSSPGAAGFSVIVALYFLDRQEEPKPLASDRPSIQEAGSKRMSPTTSSSIALLSWLSESLSEDDSEIFSSVLSLVEAGVIERRGMVATKAVVDERHTCCVATTTTNSRPSGHVKTSLINHAFKTTQCDEL
jgi:hypothetical protein